MDAFTIRNLTFSYPNAAVPALEDITLSVGAGSFICLCGASGSGKSTLLRQLKPALAPHGVALFPVQLLEATLNFILFLFLYHYAKKPRKPGAVLGLYLVCYAVERFGLEYLRFDEIRGFLFGISTSQWISMLLIPIGLFLIFVPFEKKIGMAPLAGPGVFVKKDEEEKAEDGEAPKESEETAAADEETKTSEETIPETDASERKDEAETDVKEAADDAPQA